MLWYVLYLGLIAAGYLVAHVIGVRGAHAERLQTPIARERIQRVFDCGACQSYERIEAIGRRLSDSLGAHEGRQQFTMAQLDRTIADATRAYVHFSEVIADLTTSSQQLKDALGEFCRKYSELVLLIGDAAQQSEHEIAPDERFRAWTQDDEAFARELKRLTSEAEYLPLARAIRGFFGENGFMASQSLKTVVTRGSMDVKPQAYPIGEEEIRLRSRDRFVARREINRAH
jgi:hypothetical protein